MNSLHDDENQPDQLSSSSFLLKQIYSDYLSPYLLQVLALFDMSINCYKSGENFITCVYSLKDYAWFIFLLLIYTAIIASFTVLAISVAIKVFSFQRKKESLNYMAEYTHVDQITNDKYCMKEMSSENFTENPTDENSCLHCVDKLKYNTKFFDQIQMLFTKKKVMIIVLLYWFLESFFVFNHFVVNFHYCNFHNEFNNSGPSRPKEKTSNYIESSLFICETFLTYTFAFPYLFACLMILSRKLLKFWSLVSICLIFASLFAFCKIITLFFIYLTSNSLMCNASMQRFIRSCVAVVAMSIGIAAAPSNMFSNKNYESLDHDTKGGSLTERYYWKNAETETNKHRGRYPKENKPNAKDFSDNEASLKKDLPHTSEGKSSRRLSAVKPHSDTFVPCVVLMPKSKARHTFSHNSTTGTGMVVGTCVKFHSSNKMRRRFSLDTEHGRKNFEEDISNVYRNMKRRTSLPTSLLSSRKKIVMSSVLVESGTIVEINTVLRDLIALTHGTPEINQYVTKLQKLLKPYQTEHLRPSQVVWLHDSLSAATSDGSDDEEVNRGVRQVFPKRSHRDWPSRDKSLWTTTTSATGLPSKDPGPVKPIRLPISKTPNSTPRDSRCNSPICSSKDICLPRRRTPMLSPGHASKQFFKPLESTGKDVNDNNSLKDISKLTLSDDSGCQDNNHTDSSECDVPISSHGNRTPPISHSVMHDSNALLHASSHLAESLEMDTGLPKTPKLRMLVPTIDETCEDEEVMSHDDPALKNNKQNDDVAISDACSQGADSGRLSANLEHYHGECLFQTTKYHGSLMEQVPSWNFPIFSLADKTHCVLSQMAYKLFDDTGLFHIFKIPRHLFVNYMRALENGYRNIAYHNRIHAADVLHGCWFLTTQQVHDFHERSHLFASESSDSDSGTSTIQSERHQVNNIGHTSLATAIPALELMALYLAAAMHDYDHPGRTNAFLVETRHPLAMLYNDRSVLENHHASASWELLHSRNDGAFDFLQNLKTAEWKRLRFLIVEAILATDLKKHFELMNKFMSRTSKPRSTSQSSEGSGCEESITNGINWAKDEDRLLVCQMVIKLADISGPTKSRNLHVTWTKAICEEFFTQGDEERRLEVPLSLYMDRSEPKVAALQRTFIKNLIDPLVKAMYNAGILAGRCDAEDTEYESDSNSVDVLGSSPGSTCIQPHNVILSQLSSNSRQWKLMEDRKLPGKEEMDTSFSTAHFVKLEHEGYPQLPILTADDDKFAEIRDKESQVASQKSNENVHEDENDAEIASINSVNNNETDDHRKQKSSFRVVTSSRFKKNEDLNKNVTPRSNIICIPKAKNRHSELKSTEGAS